MVSVACVDNLAKSSETAWEKGRLLTREEFLVAALVLGIGVGMRMLSQNDLVPSGVGQNFALVSGKVSRLWTACRETTLNESKNRPFHLLLITRSLSSHHHFAKDPHCLEMTSPCLGPPPLSSFLHNVHQKPPRPCYSKDGKKTFWPDHIPPRLAIQCPGCEHVWNITEPCGVPGPRVFKDAPVIPCLGQAKELLWVIHGVPILGGITQSHYH